MKVEDASTTRGLVQSLAKNIFTFIFGQLTDLGVFVTLIYSEGTMIPPARRSQRKPTTMTTKAPYSKNPLHHASLLRIRWGEAGRRPEEGSASRWGMGSPGVVLPIVALALIRAKSNPTEAIRAYPSITTFFGPLLDCRAGARRKTIPAPTPLSPCLILRLVEGVPAFRA